MSNLFHFLVNLCKLLNWKYDINEKQAYGLVKAVKAFRCYLMGAIMISFVPSVAVKDLFS